MNDLEALGPRELWSALRLDVGLREVLALAMAEDLGETGDVTSASIVAPERQGRALLRARHDGVTAGLSGGRIIVESFGGTVHWNPIVADGSDCGAGQVLAELVGPLADLLALERTALNLIGRLSGIATLTRRYVDAVLGTGAVVCDTRKTTPGLRGLEKYAVRCGGGTMHRMGLYDAVLYKDNHLAGIPLASLGERLTAAIARARQHPVRFVEVEVDTLEQLEVVLGLEPGLIDWVLLDNMPPATLCDAVALRDRHAPLARLEASGGVTLETIRAVAETGVERVSVGALTHAASALDVGLDLEAGEA
jgi:nicotinate-nucleotide pyrophosphorylase (carboxylating)